MFRTNTYPDAEDKHNIFWNRDRTRGILIELVGETRYYYYISIDKPDRKIRFSHATNIDTPDGIYKAHKAGRYYAYWLTDEYIQVASSVNPISYSTDFDLYHWPVNYMNNNHVLGPRFIFSVPGEEKSNHIRLCLVPELSRVEDTCDLSMRVNPVSGEIEYTESRKIQLVAGYDDMLSVNSGMCARCFQWRVIPIPIPIHSSSV